MVLTAHTQTHIYLDTAAHINTYMGHTHSQKHKETDTYIQPDTTYTQIHIQDTGTDRQTDAHTDGSSSYRSALHPFLTLP
jgi:hypothetical protein